MAKFTAKDNIYVYFVQYELYKIGPNSNTINNLAKKFFQILLYYEVEIFDINFSVQVKKSITFLNIELLMYNYFPEICYYYFRYFNYHYTTDHLIKWNISRKNIYNISNVYFCVKHENGQYGDIISLINKKKSVYFNIDNIYEHIFKSCKKCYITYKTESDFKQKHFVVSNKLAPVKIPEIKSDFDKKHIIIPQLDNKHKVRDTSTHNIKCKKLKFIDFFNYIASTNFMNFFETSFKNSDQLYLIRLNESIIIDVWKFKYVNKNHFS